MKNKSLAIITLNTLLGPVALAGATGSFSRSSAESSKDDNQDSPRGCKEEAMKKGESDS